MFNQAGKPRIHASDTSQEISLTICLHLPDTLPSFQFYQGLKIPSLKKFWWTSATPVRQGKEIQEEATQNPPSPRRGRAWAARLQGWVRQEPTEATAKGRCLSNTPTSRANVRQRSRTTLRFSSVERPTTWPRLSRRAGTHKRPVTSRGGGGRPRQVMCQGPAGGLPPGERRSAWQIRWDWATASPAKRPNSQAAVVF